MSWLVDLVPRTRPTREFFVVLVRTLPFSALLITAIFTTAAITNTLAHPISVAGLDVWGFGPDQLSGTRFYQLFFAPFQVYRPYMAITIAATILLFVGACEYRLGTLRAMGAFWAGHVIGYVPVEQD